LQPFNRYAPSAARAPGSLGRAHRSSSITIDIHSHVTVPQAADYVRPHLDPATIPLAAFATPETRALNGLQDAARTSRMTQYDERLQDLDDMGLDMQVVMPPPPQCYFTLAPEVAVPAIRMVNDGIAEYVSGRPDRFVGLGTVPLQDGIEAAAELERCMGALQLKGVEILTNVAGNEISDAGYAPFWAKAEKLGALVVLHPNGFTEARRLTRFYFNNVIGNPLETTIALHYLIFDGVLERHPGLKILAVHGGGYLGAYSGRIDHAWGARSDARGGLPRPPTAYLKLVYFDSVVFTPHQLQHLISVFGYDHIAMGTDYPYDMAEYDPLGHLGTLDALDQTAIAAIAGQNAMQLLGL
jgi:aminocarboxymuconate-semialdehyde decarboxylase